MSEQVLQNNQNIDSRQQTILALQWQTFSKGWFGAGEGGCHPLDGERSADDFSIFPNIPFIAEAGIISSGIAFECYSVSAVSVTESSWGSRSILLDKVLNWWSKSITTYRW